MKFTDIKEISDAARSIRVYDPSRPAGKDNLEYFIECARFCPSAANLQPLKYRLCYEKEESASLLALTKWAGYLKDVKLPPEGKGPTDFIVICHDKSICPATDYTMMDVGIAAQTINLAARERGYGCCMIGSFDKEETANLLGIPEHLTPILVIAIGTPAEEPIICSLPKDGSIKYFRDAADLHFVPKRSVEEVIIK